MSEKVQLAIMITSLCLNVIAILTAIYAFYRFINKPRTDLETRVATLEIQVKETKDSLYQGNDRFREQHKTNEMIFSVLLAFVDFEIAYCHHTGYEHDADLLRARDKLQQYLSDR